MKQTIMHVSYVSAVPTNKITIFKVPSVYIDLTKMYFSRTSRQSHIYKNLVRKFYHATLKNKNCYNTLNFERVKEKLFSVMSVKLSKN